MTDLLPCVTLTMDALALTELLLLMTVGLLCFDLHLQIIIISMIQNTSNPTYLIVNLRLLELQ